LIETRRVFSSSTGTGNTAGILSGRNGPSKNPKIFNRNRPEIFLLNCPLKPGAQNRVRVNRIIRQKDRSKFDLLLTATIATLDMINNGDFTYQSLFDGIFFPRNPISTRCHVILNNIIFLATEALGNHEVDRMTRNVTDIIKSGLYYWVTGYKLSSINYRL